MLLAPLPLADQARRGVQISRENSLAGTLTHSQIIYIPAPRNPCLMSGSRHDALDTDSLIACSCAKPIGNRVPVALGKEVTVIDYADPAVRGG